MLEKNQCYITDITDLTAEGSGVCRIDDMVVFVPSTAVGDKIKVKIVKVLKNYAFGIIDELICESKDRVQSDCNVSKKCGGCLFRHVSYEAECKVKDNIVRNAFSRMAALTPEFDDFMPCEKTIRYRNKAQYPLAVMDGKAVCGFYAPRSHRVIPVNDCILQPEIFSDIIGDILEYINVNAIPVYNEELHNGLIRHIYLRKGEHSNEIMVCIVVRSDCRNKLNNLIQVLADKYNDIKSIVMNINPDKTNVILGHKNITLYGSDTITDIMCGNKIEISPLSFYQVNTLQAERLYAKALEYASPDKESVIADLYCGAGTIGLSMADHVKKIIGVEIIPEAVDNAKENALINSVTNAEFYCGDTGKVFSELRNKGCAPDIIVIDPPRKGCSVETLEVITRAKPKKIIMISCNPSTAARDAKWLSENGYRLKKVCGVDMFPRTGHVECVAQFEYVNLDK